MSSGEYQNHSENDHNDHDYEQKKEKKVCFICGSHTIFIINIHDKRVGPDMIDVIKQKFNMQILNDDKFLCYSCNNWLINWYSMQNKNDTNDESTAEASSSAAAAASIAPRGSDRSPETAAGRRGNQKYTATATVKAITQKTSKGIVNVALNEMHTNVPVTQFNNSDGNDEDDDDDVAAIMVNDEINYINSITDRGDNDFVLTAAIKAVRTKLQKYLYYPSKQKNIYQLAVNYYNQEYQMPSHHIDVQPYCYRIEKCARSISSPDTVKKRKIQRYCKVCCKRICIRQQLPEFRRKNNFNRRTPKRITLKRRQQNTTIRICRKCIYSMHMRMHIKGNCNSSISTSLLCYRSKRKFKKQIVSSQAADSNKILNNSNIVDKLKLLGTSIYYETDNCVQREHTQLPQHQRTEKHIHFNSNDNVHLISSRKMDEIDTDLKIPMPSLSTMNGTAPPSSLQPEQFITNDQNEILLTFNTVVTEVFPIFTTDAGTYNFNYKHHHHIDESKQINCERKMNLHEIIKNVPKSLTITLA